MNKINNIIKIALIFILMQNSTAFGASIINDIIVEGNQRIESPTIINYSGIKKGEPYSEGKMSEVIKNLYATSFFQDIKTSYQNNNLIISVIENPFISKVEILGNSKLSSKVISKELSTQAGESLSNVRIQEDNKKIQHMYKSSGRFATIVTNRVEQLDNNRVKVIFDIKEGPKTDIKNIYFVGNENYSPSELKNILLTKESRWYKFLEKNDNYDPYRVEYDKEMLIEFYRSVGYVDANVISVVAELAPTKEYFNLTYTIDEGQKYKIGKVEVENKLGINCDQIDKYINLAPGQLYNIKKLDTVSENINKYLANIGYPQAEVTHEVVNKDVVNNIIDLKYVVEKASKVYINHINIEGNVKTNEEILRREFKIAEGDVFNRLPIETAEKNIRQLDFFEKINTTMSPTKIADRYDVNIEVLEKSTSIISFDFGYSTAAGPIGKISFTERNLLGEGKLLSMGVDVTKTSNNIYLVVGNPYFLGKDIDLNLTFFKSHDGKTKLKKRKIKAFTPEQQPYTKDTIGFKPSIDYAINEDFLHSIDYTIKREKLTGNPNTLARSIVEQLGKYTTSAVGHTLTYNKIDNIYIPKNGYSASFSQEYAGVGGDNKYFKNEIDLKSFYSIKNNHITFKLNGRGGNVKGMGGKSVKIADKFYMGDFNFRGFSSRGIGPRDKLTQEALGGLNFYTVTAEVQFPLTINNDFDLKGLLFTDVGSLWGIDFKRNKNYTKNEFHNDKSTRASVGFGFIWNTRFAPIRIDWGFPIRRKKYDEVQNFHLKLSTHL